MGGEYIKLGGDCTLISAHKHRMMAAPQSLVSITAILCILALKVYM